MRTGLVRGRAAPVLRWVGALALFALFHLVWSPVGSVSPAHAQINCPDAAAINPVQTTVRFNQDTGTCVLGGAIPTNGVQAALSPAITRLILQPRDGGANEPPTSLTCPSANTTASIGGVNGVVIFTAANTCNFTSTSDVGGTIITMTGTVTFDGVNTMNTTNVIVNITTPATGPTAQDKSNITAALQNSLNSVTPGLLSGGLPLNGNGAANGNGIAFSPTGLGFARSSIDSANPMDRQFGSAFAPQGYFAHRDTRQRNNGFNFSVDLNQMAASANKKESAALAYGENGSKDGPSRPRSRFNSWVTGSYVDFDDNETNADRDGSLWVVTSGLSVQMNANTTVGVLSRYRSGEVDSTALTASLDIEAYGGGAYLTTTLGDGLNVAVAALYEMGDNDISISGDTGSFDSEQFTVEGKIDKRITRGRTWIEPAVALLYISTDQDNYTDSAGTVVAGQDLTLGRLTFGPTIGTTISRGNTQIRPFAKVNGVWDFENEGNFTTSTAGTFTTGDAAINLGGGVEVVYASGFAIKLAGDWFTFDSDLEAWSISGGIGAPLSAFGIGSAGTVSLNLTSNAEDASATARVRIPLN